MNKKPFKKLKISKDTKEWAWAAFGAIVIWASVLGVGFTLQKKHDRESRIILEKKYEMERELWQLENREFNVDTWDSIRKLERNIKLLEIEDNNKFKQSLDLDDARNLKKQILKEYNQQSR